MNRHDIVPLHARMKKQHAGAVFSRVCLCEESNSTCSVHLADRLLSFGRNLPRKVFDSLLLFSRKTDAQQRHQNKKPAYAGFLSLCLCEESNLDQELRSLLFYPLNYRGMNAGNRLNCRSMKSAFSSIPTETMSA